MLPERAIRYIIEGDKLTDLEFWQSRHLALLDQETEYRRHYAEIDQPVDTQPVTLTGDAWRDAVDTEIDAVLGLIY